MEKILAILIIIFMLCGCARPSTPPLERFSETKEFFGSAVKLDVCYSPSQKDSLDRAIDAVWTRFADIHWRLSVYDPMSDLNRINASFPDPVTVGPDTYGLIKDSLYYHSLVSGEFDITIFPLLKLWRAAEKRGSLPEPEEILAAQERMGVRHVELLDRNRVRLLSPDVRLTIDSIADGYAADEAARILRAYGFDRFLIDASGELYGAGKNCVGQPWRIGVQSPRNPAAMVQILRLENSSITTSGNYERYYTIDGRQYSHIISPKTGFPNNDILSATVIAPNAQFSDFLSTALCLLSPEQGVALVNNLGEGYASMVIALDKDGKPFATSSKNYPRYVITDR